LELCTGTGVVPLCEVEEDLQRNLVVSHSRYVGISNVGRHYYVCKYFLMLHRACMYMDFKITCGIYLPFV
jgi:hypothetical protein